MKQYTLLLAVLALGVSACGGSSPTGPTPPTTFGGGAPPPERCLMYRISDHLRDGELPPGTGFGLIFPIRSTGTLDVTISWGGAESITSILLFTERSADDPGELLIRDDETTNPKTVEYVVTEPVEDPVRCSRYCPDLAYNVTFHNFTSHTVSNLTGEIGFTSEGGADPRISDGGRGNCR